MVRTDFHKGLQRMSQRLGLPRFFDWWLGELAAMLPRALSDLPGSAAEGKLLVEISGSQVVFSRVVDGGLAEAGRMLITSMDAVAQRQEFQSVLKKAGRQASEVCLCLRPEQVLRKKLVLPRLVEENLRQVITFEMDRHTPFKSEQVYFDCRVARQEKQLEVLLAVAPRAVVDEPLRQIRAWGGQVAAVLVADDMMSPMALNLLPEERRETGRDVRRMRQNILLAAVAAILLGIALALPAWQKRETVKALHPLLAKAHQQATVAEDLRRQLDVLLAEYNYLLDMKRSAPPVVAVLEEVTRILPDDTWVQQFDLKGKEMQIQGETASSSKLANLFEQSKTLHDASFRAPLTKGQGVNSERFHLAVETRPLPRAETEAQSSPQSLQPVATPPRPAQAGPEAPAALPATGVGAKVEKKNEASQPLPAMPDAPKTGQNAAARKAEEKPVVSTTDGAAGRKP